MSRKIIQRAFGGDMAAGGIIELPFTPGWDLAGTVEAIGTNVNHIEPGQRVLGLARFPGTEAHAPSALVCPPRARRATWRPMRPVPPTSNTESGWLFTAHPSVSARGRRAGRKSGRRCRRRRSGCRYR